MVVVVGGWRIYEVSGPQILERGGVDRGTGGSNRLSDSSRVRVVMLRIDRAFVSDASRTRGGYRDPSDNM